MDGTTRCGTCFRSERVRDGVPEVLIPGGGRRPDVPADLAIWRTYRRVAAGEIDAPVARCAACGQPAFGVEGALPAIGWTISLPDGDVPIGPDGHVIDGDDADADRRIEDHHRAATEWRPTKGELGFALVASLLGAGLAAMIGLIDCPSVAIGLAAAAAAPAATKAMRGSRR